MTDAPLPPWYYQQSAPVVADWGQVVSFSPGTYFTPKSLNEVSSILLYASTTSGRTLRIMGGLHSCSNIFKSDIVIDTSGLPLEFAPVSNDPDGCNVIASGWMHVHEFGYRASQIGLSLTATGGTDAQTLAGLIATNTAGATIKYSVYETVQWVELLQLAADGKSINTVTIKRTDPAFQAVICSLGLLGFVTRIGFTLVPEIFLTASQSLVPLDDVLGSIDDYSQKHDFWRVLWLPKLKNADGKDIGLLWTADHSVGVGAPNGDYPPDGQESSLMIAAKYNEKFLKSGPFLSIVLEDVYKLLVALWKNQSVSGPLRNLIPVDRMARVHCAMAEWSFNPVDIPRVKTMLTTYFEANGWPNLAIEIECTRTDTYLMSAWNWPELPYIAKINFQYLTEFFEDGDKARMKAHILGIWNMLDGADIPFKAHWGKLNCLDAAQVAKTYDLAAFLPYVEPLFLNGYTKRRLMVGS